MSAIATNLYFFKLFSFLFIIETMSIIYLYYIASFFTCQFDIKEKWDEIQVLFQAMIFETAFQNLVVLIYVVKTDLFCFMRSAFLLYITLISCHNYLNI